MDYLDPTKTDDEVYETYFKGLENTILEERQFDLEDNLEVVVLDIVQIDDITFELLLQFTSNGEVEEGNIRVKVKRIDATSPMLLLIEGIDDDCNGTDECYNEEVILNPDDVFMYVNDFLLSYNDSTITDDEIFMYYWDILPNWVLNRQQYLSEGTTLEVTNVTPNMEYGEGVFDIEITAKNNDQVLGTTVQATVVIRYADMIGFFVAPSYEPEECQLFTNVCHLIVDSAVATEQLNSFLMDLSDTTITTDELMMRVMEPSFLLYDRYDGIIWTLESNIETDGVGTFYFTVMAQHAEGIVHRDIAARVYETNYGVLIYFLELYDYCDLYPEDCHYDPLIRDLEYTKYVFESHVGCLEA